MNELTMKQRAERYRAIRAVANKIAKEKAQQLIERRRNAEEARHLAQWEVSDV